MTENDKIVSFIEETIATAFKKEDREYDAKYLIVDLNSAAVLVFMKTKYQRVYRRVAEKLILDFKKEFNRNIHFFEAIKGFTEYKGLYQDLKYKYSLIAYNGTKDDTTIDPNNTVCYIPRTIFGDFAISIFNSKDDETFGNIHYDGWGSIFGEEDETRILSLDLMDLHEGKTLNYKGRSGWDEFRYDYRQCCGGQEPDYGITVTILKQYDPEQTLPE